MGTTNNKPLKERFIDSLKAAGAGCLETDIDEVNLYLNENYPDIKDFSDRSIWHKYQNLSPEELSKEIDVVMIEGRLGVAENGAIWVDESVFPVRLIPFIARQLIIRINKSDIVSDMHQACSVISTIDVGFGVFISGPSKTADIEQSLVYGAHGAISLLVVII